MGLNDIASLFASFLGAVTGNAGMIVGLIPVALAYVFRSKIMGFVGGAAKGGGTSLALIAGALGFAVGWIASSSLTGGNYEAMLMRTLKAEQAFLNRTAVVENRCWTQTALHLEQNLACVRRLDETADLTKAVIRADEEGRQRANERIARIKDEARRAGEYYDQQIRIIEDAKSNNADVLEYLETPVPVELHGVLGLRNNDGSSSRHPPNANADDQ